MKILLEASPTGYLWHRTQHSSFGAGYTKATQPTFQPPDNHTNHT